MAGSPEISNTKKRVVNRAEQRLLKRLQALGFTSWALTHSQPLGKRCFHPVRAVLLQLFGQQADTRRLGQLTDANPPASNRLRRRVAILQLLGRSDDRMTNQFALRGASLDPLQFLNYQNYLFFLPKLGAVCLVYLGDACCFKTKGITRGIAYPVLGLEFVFSNALRVHMLPALAVQKSMRVLADLGCESQRLNRLARAQKRRLSSATRRNSTVQIMQASSEVDSAGLACTWLGVLLLALVMNVTLLAFAADCPAGLVTPVCDGMRDFLQMLDLLASERSLRFIAAYPAVFALLSFFVALPSTCRKGSNARFIMKRLDCRGKCRPAVKNDDLMVTFNPAGPAKIAGDHEARAKRVDRMRSKAAPKQGVSSGGPVAQV